MPVVNLETKHLSETGSKAADGGVSLPLYAGGLLVTLSGVLTVATAIAPSSGTAVESVAIMLTLLGYAFSLACRHLKVQPRMIETGFVAFLIYIVALLAMHDRNLDWFLSGADRQDTRLAAGLMWLAILRSWTLLSDDLVMMSCVWSAAMIGLIGTQDVNTVTVVYFCLFIMGLVFLLIHHNYLQSRRLATPHERARPFASLLPAQVGLTALCGLVVLALGTVLITPAQALFANVSLAQAIRGLVGTDRVHDADAVPGATRFSDDANLEIGKGSVWPTTSDVMLHATVSDGAPHYWRGRTYDLYLGTGWQSTQDDFLPVTVSGELPEGTLFAIPTSSILGEGAATRHSIPRQPLISSVEVRGDTDQFYYPDEPRSILLDPGNGQPRPSTDGRIDLGGHPVRSVYTVRSLPPPDLDAPDVQARLRQDGTDYPSDVREFYLRSPLDPQDFVTTPADVRVYRSVLAEALAGLPPDRRTPFDKAVAIRDWIAGHCVYSLDVDAIPPDTDHVRHFLKDERRGYCDLFASSMVILCRVAGIPARVATGFAPGDRDDTGFNLRAMDKHAWAEVYFPGDRWQIFDATVGTRTDGSVPVARAATVNFLTRAWNALTQGGVVTQVIAVAILISLAYLGKTEIYDRFQGAPRVRPVRVDPAEYGYGVLMRTLARLGLPRRPWETPAEFEPRAVSFLTALQAELGVPLRPAIVGIVTARFIAIRYGSAPSSADPEIERGLREFALAAARARRIRFWRRFWHVKPIRAADVTR